MIFRLQIQELFSMQDGRTVLAGVDEGGGAKTFPAGGPVDVWVDDRKVATVHVHPEIPLRPISTDPERLIAVSTREPTGLTRELVLTGRCRLQAAAPPGPPELVGAGAASRPPEGG
jgi:hypothetical protein